MALCKLDYTLAVTGAEARSMSGHIRIGIGGWTYEPWRGTFYPATLVQKRELEYAAGKLSSIEVDRKTHV